MLVPHRLKVGCETFVEPDVRPVAACNVIAEPLVREFVRLQPILIAVKFGASVVNHVVGLRSGRDILHAAAEIARHRLRVLIVRVFQSRFFGEELDHFGKARRCNLASLQFVRIDVSDNGNPSVVAFNGHVFAYDYRSQVSCVRYIYLPMKGARVVFVVLSLHELAVGDDHQGLFDCCENLRRREIVRVVVANHPIMIIFSFPLRPDLFRPVRLFRRGLYEGQPAPESADAGCSGSAVSVVGDNKRHKVRRLIGAVHCDSELLVRHVRLELQGRAVG